MLVKKYAPTYREVLKEYIQDKYKINVLDDTIKGHLCPDVAFKQPDCITGTCPPKYGTLCENHWCAEYEGEEIREKRVEEFVLGTLSSYGRYRDAIEEYTKSHDLT